VSGVGAAAGLKSGQSNRRRNFEVSNMGAFRRSKLILFVLVLVLVLVLEKILILEYEHEDEDEDDDESRTLQPGAEIHKK